MNKRIQLYSIAVLMLLSLGSCKKFMDVNKNPNSPTQTNSAFVFTGALGTTFRNQVGNPHIVSGTWVGFYAHSTSYTGGGAEKTYSFTNSDFNYFDSYYDNLSDYQYVIENADKDGVGFWKDPASVMQCYVYQQLVDVYGDVPYSQTFLGIKNIAPAYDKQQTIYEDLVKRLDSAIVRIKRTAWLTSTDFTRQDIFFAGNKSKWIRFANTLKLRILMRQSFMPGRNAYITANISTTLADGYLQENTLCSPGFQNIAGKLNPFYANYGYNELNNVVTGHQYRKMNAVMINWLKSSLDTFRLQKIAWPKGATPTAPSANLADYVGVPLGISSGFATAGASPFGPMVVQRGEGTRPGIFMTLAEAYFLQAEAAQRYAIAGLGVPQTLYESGILAHYRLLSNPTLVAGGTDGDAFAARYINRPVANVNWAASTDKIKAILIQKWVSLIHVNGQEAWSEYRKSSGSPSVGVPASVKSTVVNAGDPEPARLYYPLTESNTNGNNVPDPKTINVFTTKIFWDVN